MHAWKPVVWQTDEMHKDITILYMNKDHELITK